MSEENAGDRSSHKTSTFPKYSDINSPETLPPLLTSQRQVSFGLQNGADWFGNDPNSENQSPNQIVGENDSEMMKEKSLKLN